MPGTERQTTPPDQKVISTGPYALVRHPMYTGALVMLLDFARFVVGVARHRRDDSRAYMETN
jgi:protein-S-isoprenylcysteine O-methyltransferase Ste14